MSDSKKKRMSMLDQLASAGAQAPAPLSPMMSSNRALRSARDAVDAHQVWELDPGAINDTRIADRLDPEDVQDLREAIETNGQTVPILVRRDPSAPDRYLLVYGRRRLEAIRLSDKVETIRALVASLDDDTALRAQISENMARRDLSYIEKALFARELMDSGFGNQSQVAEVLTVTKSSISMAMAILELVGPDLARAIGPAHGIGRPRWEALGKAIEAAGADRARLTDIAYKARDDFALSVVTEVDSQDQDASAMAFAALEKALAAKPRSRTAPPPPSPTSTLPIRIAGHRGGTVKRTARGAVSINLDSGPFADWLETEAQALVEELHARWLQRSED